MPDNKVIEKINYNGTTYEVGIQSLATSQEKGLMSPTDKMRLDNMEVSSIAGTAPISVSAPNDNGVVTISHNNSNVTANTYGTTATTALTPAFGATFSVPGFTVNASGHITAAGTHTVKIPATIATSGEDGLMSKADKANFDLGVTIAGNTVAIGGDLAANTLRTSLGLSTAMHFMGISTVAITDGSTTNPTITGYDFGTNGANAQKGDVVIDKDSAYEFVWTGSKWERLGPDGSYALSDHTHANATSGEAGFMSANDKANFDAGISIAGNTVNLGGSLSASDLRDSLQYVPSFVNYQNTSGNNSGKYYKIAINSYIGWMINFTVKLYHNYKSYDLQISGYNYAANHWHLPKAVLLGTSETSSIEVLFGYDSNYHLWVAIPADKYSGISVCGIANGYTKIADFENLFTITMVDAEPTTKQTTVTARKPLYVDEAGTLATKSTIGNHSVTTPTGATSRTADVALNTTTVNSITDVGALPSLTVTATNVVTGGTTTAIPNISKKTVVTSATAAKATYSSGILTISDGSVTTGDSVTVDTAINAYTALTTSSIGSASNWSAGTLPTKGSNTAVATSVKTQPTFSVTTTTTTLSHTIS